MLFVEPRFFVFLAIVLGVHWALPSHRSRKLWLLFTSWVFYGSWDWRFLGLLIGTTTLDFAMALAIGGARTPGARKALLVVSIVANLGVLGVFKYFDFFVSVAADALHLIGLPFRPGSLSIILPAGVSFYTLQSMSYTIDVYREKMPATRSFVDMALYVAFFPQLVAGPIVRATTFVPQLESKKYFADVDVRACLVVLLVGYFKKACVADSVAPTVDAFFGNPGGYGPPSAWLAVSLYAVQIYCDFSGYSDMAIGLAGLFGYELCENFAFPYFAESVSELWQRWHMSLSTWLRDYVYFPLGGSRGTTLQTSKRLILTMLLCGLWHGAGWNYIVWGGMNGVWLAAERALRSPRVRSPGGVAPLATRVVRVARTFGGFLLLASVFRSPTLATAKVVLGEMLFVSSGTRVLDPALGVAFVALASLHWVGYSGVVRQWWRGPPWWCFAAAYGVAASIAMALIPVDVRPFIYFQF